MATIRSLLICFLLLFPWRRVLNNYNTQQKYQFEVSLNGTSAKSQAPVMATPFDGISQQLDFTSGGEDGSSSGSDSSSGDYAFRIHSPRVVSPRVLSPESACRTPRVQRHRSRSSTISSPLQCTSPIPYATWRKLRLCDSPSTPKVRQPSLQMKQPCSLPWTPNPRGGYILWPLSILAEPVVQVLPALFQH